MMATLQAFIVFLCISGGSIVMENSQVAAQQSSRPNEDTKTISVPIVNHNNRTYTVLLKIGTPAQEFNVAFDTAAKTWVPANTCPDGTHCVGRKAFKSNESSTHTVISHNGFSEFRSGNVTGDEIDDVQAMGDVEIGKLRFISALSIYGAPNYTEEPFDGVFGLRLGPNSPLTHMARTGVISKPWLGLYFSADNDVPGEALFGGANEQHYQGQLSFVDAELDTFQFRITRYDYDGVNRIFATSDPQSTAVLAPAEQFILGPYREIYSLNELLGGRFTNEGYEFFCGFRPANVIFTIATKRIVLTAEDYIFKVDTPSGTKCYSAFKTAYRGDDAAAWHLGIPFLRRAYTVLEAPSDSRRHGRVGFAPVRSL